MEFSLNGKATLLDLVLPAGDSGTCSGGHGWAIALTVHPSSLHNPRNERLARRRWPTHPSLPETFLVWALKSPVTKETPQAQADQDSLSQKTYRLLPQGVSSRPEIRQIHKQKSVRPLKKHIGRKAFSKRETTCVWRINSFHKWSFLAF